MFKSDTFIIEMTGIMGAGYLPGLFQPLTEILRTEYNRIYDEKKFRGIITRYHIDNSAASKENKEKRDRITELIIKTGRAE